MSAATTKDSRPADVLIIGAGPSGLIAADALSEQGLTVHLIERMPSPARKLLMAGRGGLNLTHSEAAEAFLARYREAAPFLRAAIEGFSPGDLRTWCEELGISTFTGSSGRVFPLAMKASPLLRALLARLAARGVRLTTRWSWRGFDEDGALRFDTPSGPRSLPRPRAVLLALGGASWPRLGGDGGWSDEIDRLGIARRAFMPANGGFTINWSETFAARHAGTPLKRVALTAGEHQVRGEAMITANGIEGGAVYALSAEIRDELQRSGQALLTVDLRPDLELAALTSRISAPRGKRSLSTHLRKTAGLPPVAIALLSEAGPRPATPEDLAARIKALPLTLTGSFGLERAISSAGGIAWAELDADFMLKRLPGVFVAGEMIDWEAPTGGYLLQACFATGRAAAAGIAKRLASAPEEAR